MLPINDLLNNAAAARSAASNPEAFLQRVAKTPAANSNAHAANGGAPASEFAKLFPGAAAKRAAKGVAPAQGPAANTGVVGGVSSSQLQTSKDIQSEVALDPERKRLYNAALDFQGIFIGKMLKAMRSNLNPKEDLLFGGNRQEIFQDMLYDEYSKSMSRSGGFDLADQMYRQLSAKLPPVPGSASGAARVQGAGGRFSTGQVQAPAVQLDGARNYKANTNRISTEQIWNENDWRP